MQVYYDLLGAMGVRVREVDDLDEGALYMWNCGLLVLDKNLLPERRLRILDHYVQVAATQSVA